MQTILSTSQKFTISHSCVNRESCKDTSVMLLFYCVLMQFQAHFNLNFSLFLLNGAGESISATAPMGLWGESIEKISCIFPNGSLVSVSNYFACQSPYTWLWQLEPLNLTGGDWGSYLGKEFKRNQSKYHVSHQWSSPVFIKRTAGDQVLKDYHKVMQIIFNDILF